MSKIIYQSDYKTLRQAYLEIKDFVEGETGATISTLNTKIEADLRIAGDDIVELLEKYVSKYKLNAVNFNYSKYFHSEVELFDGGAAFLRILVLPIAVVALIIEIVSFNKLDLKIGRLFSFWQRETLDLSFGDLLTWYLTGSFYLRNQVKVVI